MKNYSDIEEIQNFLIDSYTMKYLAITIIVVEFYNILQNLKSILPSFGVLFDTIHQAKNDFFTFIQVNFSLVILTLYKII